MNLGSKVGQKSVVVRKTEKLGERTQGPISLRGKGQDDDDDDDFPTSFIQYCSMTLSSCQFFFPSITLINNASSYRRTNVDQ